MNSNRMTMAGFLDRMPGPTCPFPVTELLLEHAAVAGPIERKMP